MKARVLLFLMTAFLLGACSSDDEQIAVTEGSLEGRWIEVYEPHVVNQNEMNYQLSDDGKRIRLWGGFCATTAQEYEIVKFTGHRMEWKINDRKLYFERR